MIGRGSDLERGIPRQAQKVERGKVDDLLAVRDAVCAEVSGEPRPWAAPRTLEMAPA